MFRKTYFPASLNIILLLVLITGISSCADEKNTSSEAKQETQKKSLTTQRALSAPTGNTGIVKSIQNAGSYSYIEVDINGQVYWMASSIAAVKAGEKISWNGHAMMSNFNSKSLNRTFEQIMFVDKVLPAAALQKSLHSGKVVETMDSAGYSYIQVKEQGKMVWLAAPATKISVGQTISWSSGAAMQNFSSKSLNKTFKEIFFISAIQLVNS